LQLNLYTKCLKLKPDKGYRLFEGRLIIPVKVDYRKLVIEKLPGIRYSRNYRKK